MRIFCRLPRAGYKTAVDTDLHAPLNDAYHVQVTYQGAASTRRTIAETGKPVPLSCGERAQEPECRVYFLPFRQGQQCSWPEYPSLRNAWAFSFRLRRYRERWRGGHVGKKENRGLFPGLRFSIFTDHCGFCNYPLLAKLFAVNIRYQFAISDSFS